MNNLELKGGILEMISKIQDNNTLIELKDLLTNFIGNHIQDTDYWDELSDEERNELEKAIQESHNESNLVDHKVVENKLKKWLER